MMTRGEKPCCSLCSKNEAVLECEEDAARLCAACDVLVHSANKLSNRHSRWPLCSLCGLFLATRSGREDTDTDFTCEACAARLSSAELSCLQTLNGPLPPPSLRSSSPGQSQPQQQVLRRSSTPHRPSRHLQKDLPSGSRNSQHAPPPPAMRPMRSSSAASPAQAIPASLHDTEHRKSGPEHTKRKASGGMHGGNTARGCVVGLRSHDHLAPGGCSGTACSIESQDLQPGTAMHPFLPLGADTQPGHAGSAALDSFQGQLHSIQQALLASGRQGSSPAGRDARPPAHHSRTSRHSRYTPGAGAGAGPGLDSQAQGSRPHASPRIPLPPVACVSTQLLEPSLGSGQHSGRGREVWEQDSLGISSGPGPPWESSRRRWAGQHVLLPDCKLDSDLGDTGATQPTGQQAALALQQALDCQLVRCPNSPPPPWLQPLPGQEGQGKGANAGGTQGWARLSSTAVAPPPPPPLPRTLSGVLAGLPSLHSASQLALPSSADDSLGEAEDDPGQGQGREQGLGQGEGQQCRQRQPLGPDWAPVRPLRSSSPCLLDQSQLQWPGRGVASLSIGQAQVQGPGPGWQGSTQAQARGTGRACVTSTQPQAAMVPSNVPCAWPVRLAGASEGSATLPAAAAAAAAPPSAGAVAAPASQAAVKSAGLGLQAGAASQAEHQLREMATEQWAQWAETTLTSGSPLGPEDCNPNALEDAAVAAATGLPMVELPASARQQQQQHGDMDFPTHLHGGGMQHFLASTAPVPQPQEPDKALRPPPPQPPPPPPHHQPQLRHQNTTKPSTTQALAMQRQEQEQSAAFDSLFTNMLWERDGTAPAGGLGAAPGLGPTDSSNNFEELLWGHDPSSAVLGGGRSFMEGSSSGGGGGGGSPGSEGGCEGLPGDFGEGFRPQALPHSPAHPLSFLMLASSTSSGAGGLGQPGMPSLLLPHSPAPPSFDMDACLPASLPPLHMPAQCRGPPQPSTLNTRVPHLALTQAAGAGGSTETKRVAPPARPNQSLPAQPAGQPGGASWALAPPRAVSESHRSQQLSPAQAGSNAATGGCSNQGRPQGAPCDARLAAARCEGRPTAPGEGARGAGGLSHTLAPSPASAPPSASAPAIHLGSKPASGSQPARDADLLGSGPSAAVPGPARGCPPGPQPATPCAVTPFASAAGCALQENYSLGAGTGDVLGQTRLTGPAAAADRVCTAAAEQPAEEQRQLKEQQQQQQHQQQCQQQQQAHAQASLSAPQPVALLSSGPEAAAGARVPPEAPAPAPHPLYWPSGLLTTPPGLPPAPHPLHLAQQQQQQQQLSAAMAAMAAAGGLPLPGCDLGLHGAGLGRLLGLGLGLGPGPSLPGLLGLQQHPPGLPQPAPALSSAASLRPLLPHGVAQGQAMAAMQAFVQAHASRQQGSGAATQAPSLATDAEGQRQGSQQQQGGQGQEQLESRAAGQAGRPGPSSSVAPGGGGTSLSMTCPRYHSRPQPLASPAAAPSASQPTDLAMSASGQHGALTLPASLPAPTLTPDTASASATATRSAIHPAPAAPSSTPTQAPQAHLPTALGPGCNSVVPTQHPMPPDLLQAQRLTQDTALQLRPAPGPAHGLTAPGGPANSVEQDQQQQQQRRQQQGQQPEQQQQQRARSAVLSGAPCSAGQTPTQPAGTAGRGPQPSRTTLAAAAAALAASASGLQPSTLPHMLPPSLPWPQHSTAAGPPSAAVSPPDSTPGHRAAAAAAAAAAVAAASGGGGVSAEGSGILPSGPPPAPAAPLPPPRFSLPPPSAGMELPPHVQAAMAYAAQQHQAQQQHHHHMAALAQHLAPEQAGLLAHPLLAQGSLGYPGLGAYPGFPPSLAMLRPGADPSLALALALNLPALTSLPPGLPPQHLHAALAGLGMGQGLQGLGPGAAWGPYPPPGYQPPGLGQRGMNPFMPGGYPGALGPMPPAHLLQMAQAALSNQQQQQQAAVAAVSSNSQQHQHRRPSLQQPSVGATGSQHQMHPGTWPPHHPHAGLAGAASLPMQQQGGQLVPGASALAHSLSAQPSAVTGANSLGPSPAPTADRPAMSDKVATTPHKPAGTTPSTADARTATAAAAAAAAARQLSATHAAAAPGQQQAHLQQQQLPLPGLAHGGQFNTGLEGSGPALALARGLAPHHAAAVLAAGLHLPAYMQGAAAHYLGLYGGQLPHPLMAQDPLQQLLMAAWPGAGGPALATSPQGSGPLSSTAKHGAAATTRTTAQPTTTHPSTTQPATGSRGTPAPRQGSRGTPSATAPASHLPSGSGAAAGSRRGDAGGEGGAGGAGGGGRRASGALGPPDCQPPSAAALAAVAAAAAAVADGEEGSARLGLRRSGGGASAGSARAAPAAPTPAGLPGLQQAAGSGAGAGTAQEPGTFPPTPAAAVGATGSGPPGCRQVQVPGEAAGPGSGGCKSGLATSSAGVHACKGKAGGGGGGGAAPGAVGAQMLSAAQGSMGPGQRTPRAPARAAVPELHQQPGWLAGQLQHFMPPALMQHAGQAWLALQHLAQQQAHQAQQVQQSSGGTGSGWSRPPHSKGPTPSGPSPAAAPAPPGAATTTPLPGQPDPAPWPGSAPGPGVGWGLGAAAEVGELAAGGAGAGASRPSWSQTAYPDREEALLRYRRKRKLRHFEKTIRYASRQDRAQQRPRVKGRFVKGNCSHEYPTTPALLPPALPTSGPLATTPAATTYPSDDEDMEEGVLQGDSPSTALGAPPRCSPGEPLHLPRPSPAQPVTSTAPSQASQPQSHSAVAPPPPQQQQQEGSQPWSVAAARPAPAPAPPSLDLAAASSCANPAPGDPPSCPAAPPDTAAAQALSCSPPGPPPAAGPPAAAAPCTDPAVSPGVLQQVHSVQASGPLLPAEQQQQQQSHCPGAAVQPGWGQSGSLGWGGPASPYPGGPGLPPSPPLAATVAGSALQLSEEGCRGEGRLAPAASTLAQCLTAAATEEVTQNGGAGTPAAPRTSSVVRGAQAGDGPVPAMPPDVEQQGQQGQRQGQRQGQGWSSVAEVEDEGDSSRRRMLTEGPHGAARPGSPPALFTADRAQLLHPNTSLPCLLPHHETLAPLQQQLQGAADNAQASRSGTAHASGGGIMGAGRGAGGAASGTIGRMPSALPSLPRTRSHPHGARQGGSKRRRGPSHAQITGSDDGNDSELSDGGGGAGAVRGAPPNPLGGPAIMQGGAPPGTVKTTVAGSGERGGWAALPGASLSRGGALSPRGGVGQVQLGPERASGKHLPGLAGACLSPPPTSPATIQSRGIPAADPLLPPFAHPSTSIPAWSHSKTASQPASQGTATATCTATATGTGTGTCTGDLAPSICAPAAAEVRGGEADTCGLGACSQHPPSPTSLPSSWMPGSRAGPRHHTPVQHLHHPLLAPAGSAGPQPAGLLSPLYLRPVQRSQPSISKASQGSVQRSSVAHSSLREVGPGGEGRVQVTSEAGHGWEGGEAGGAGGGGG